MKVPALYLPLLAIFATATACIPHPLAHGPVPAPAAVDVDPPRLVASLRLDYPEAALDPSPPPSTLRVRLGAVAKVTDLQTFAVGLFEKHHGALGYVALGERDSFNDGPVWVSAVYASVPRDTGCRRVRLGVGFDDRKPIFVERTCEAFTRRPPSYRARALPSTATGNVEILARKGPFGGYSGTAFSGVVLDRYGDVYSAVDGPFYGYKLLDYVRTLPPEEVEQFMYDVALSRSSTVVSSSEPPTPDMPSFVVDGFLVEGQVVDLKGRRGAAASRARAWAEDNLHE